MRDLKREELLEVGFKESSYLMNLLHFDVEVNVGGVARYFFKWDENKPSQIDVDVFFPKSNITIRAEEVLQGYIPIPEAVTQKYKEIMKKLEK
ncbi:hypothetical protein VLK81_02435 [Citroniella saccharovorans]|uniref:Uncharacterized protein n=1 Tax=Citroniella saccharovorans TaxID=2053367 RepID=A0AAW9MSE5_9FIRM|nr:hypothetical protein [Citroniella saccharovorans]MEB3428890.1 hypothetical protein [Citroniella saccharovorans]